MDQFDKTQQFATYNKHITGVRRLHHPDQHDFLIAPVLGRGELLWMYSESEEYLNDFILSVLEAQAKVSLSQAGSIPALPWVYVIPYQRDLVKLESVNDSLWSLDPSKKLKILYIASDRMDLPSQLPTDDLHLSDLGIGIEILEVDSFSWESKEGDRLSKRIAKYDLVIFADYYHLFDRKKISPKFAAQFFQKYQDQGISIIVLDRCNKHGDLHKGIFKRCRADMVMKLEVTEERVSAFGKIELVLWYESAELELAHRFSSYQGLQLTFAIEVEWYFDPADQKIIKDNKRRPPGTSIDVDEAVWADH